MVRRLTDGEREREREREREKGVRRCAINTMSLKCQLLLHADALGARDLAGPASFLPPSASPCLLCCSAVRSVALHTLCCLSAVNFCLASRYLLTSRATCRHGAVTAALLGQRRPVCPPT